MKRIFIAVILSVITLAGYAQEYDKVNLLINSKNGVYQKGDSIIVWAQVRKGCAEHLNFSVRINVTDNYLINKTVSLPVGKTVLYSGVQDEPIHLIFRVTPIGEKTGSSVGVIVAPQELRPGYEPPSDLVEFWENQIQAMRLKKMKPKVTKVESEFDNFDCYAVEIPMHEGNPVTGYMAIPKFADKKSLPISIFAHGAGVNKPGNRSSIKTAVWEARRGNGTIGFDINAHGMKLGKPQEYYDALNSGDLHKYNQRPLESHDKFYFRLMYLRLVRALDYLVTRPEWDGERVLIHGSSQGGCQAGVLAGIDPRVTAALLRVPGLTDAGGKLVNGRLGGGPKPYVMNAEGELEREILPYYDTALLLSLTKADVLIETGLVDITCPPSGHCAAFNYANTPNKEILFFPYRPHMPNNIDSRHKDRYERDVKSRINEFYNEHLR